MKKMICENKTFNLKLSFNVQTYTEQSFFTPVNSFDNKLVKSNPQFSDKPFLPAFSYLSKRSV